MSEGFWWVALAVATLSGCARNRVVAQDADQPPVIEPDIERALAE